MAGESLAHLKTAVTMHGKNPEQDQGLQPEQCRVLEEESPAPQGSASVFLHGRLRAHPTCLTAACNECV